MIKVGATWGRQEGGGRRRVTGIGGRKKPSIGCKFGMKFFYLRRLEQSWVRIRGNTSLEGKKSHSEGCRDRNLRLAARAGMKKEKVRKQDICDRVYREKREDICSLERGPGKGRGGVGKGPALKVPVSRVQS